MTAELTRPTVLTSGALPGLLEGQVALVVGGCRSSAATAARLAEAGAEVTVVTPDICPDMVDLLVEGRITWQRREADELDLMTPGLVFGVSDRPRRHPRPAQTHHLR